MAVALATLHLSAQAGPAPPPRASGARGTQLLHYRPPVAAPVVDGFRPPSGDFGPGNRGLEYETRPGTPVRAIERGVVAFAGPVGATRAVTVAHPDGLRSSYTHLAHISVRVGEPLERGDRVGRAGDRLHLGVRSGTAYLDPATLFDVGARAHLVPVHSPADTRAGPTHVGP
jgi:murein DD-endopeptidase MepM/ murein hydrolase activator NlpD